MVFTELAMRGTLPVVSLLIGPDGVGKMMLALEAADFHGYPKYDTYCHRGPLHRSDAETMLAFARTAGSTVKGKLVIACLDGASATAQNALLKMLEEPPGRVKFILTASEPPLLTIFSRAFVLRCGLLTDHDVEEILILQGHDGAAARAAAALAGGRPGAALAAIGSTEDAVGRVKAALKAVSSRSTDQLAAVFRNTAGPWTGDHHKLLTQWAAEALSSRWRLFSPQDAPGLSSLDARYVLTTTDHFSGARPWLADRAVLEQLSTGRVSE